jgi:hypothetical protein
MSCTRWPWRIRSRRESLKARESRNQRKLAFEPLACEGCVCLWIVLDIPDESRPFCLMTAQSRRWGLIREGSLGFQRGVVSDTYHPSSRWKDDMAICKDGISMPELPGQDSEAFHVSNPLGALGLVTNSTGRINNTTPKVQGFASPRSWKGHTAMGTEKISIYR